MKFVIAVFLGIAVGVVGGMFLYQFVTSKEKNALNYVKAIIALAAVIGGTIYAFTFEWSLGASYIAGVCVGASPYWTALNKNNKETEEEGA